MATATETKHTALELEMFSAMRELLGEGYVPSYYEESAREFVEIAKFHGAKSQE